MATSIDFALFAANAYATSEKVVSRENEIFVSRDWTLLVPTEMSGNAGANNATGFLARAYRNDETKEIIIAYGGTTSEENMASLDWTNGNIPAASAYTLANQIVDAARFYLDVLEAHAPTDGGPSYTISFTGHSLGGGLASLMAVYFDKAAWTFDQAPFEASANSARIVDELRRELGATYALDTVAPELVLYCAGVTNYEREQQVRHTYIEGEVLRYFPAYIAALGAAINGLPGALALGGAALLASSEIAASNAGIIDPKATGVSTVALHDMRLLVALMQSPALETASRSNPDFLATLLASPLVADRPQREHDKNFLNLMIQQEVLGHKPLDRLSEDIGKFNGTLDPVASGMAGADGKLKSALYELAVALYYVQGLKGGDVFENLIVSKAGGIQFSVDVSAREDYAEVLTEVLNELGGQGGYFAYLQDYLKPEAERYTLQTEGALRVAETADDLDDLMLGGAQADDLSGGAGNDLLLGREGDDRLDGGTGEDVLFGHSGDDTLIGGDGNDVYVINTGDGNDILVDAGANRIKYNGKIVSGLFIESSDTGAFEFFKDDAKKITFNSPGVLSLDATTQITFQNQTSAESLDGSFGLQLHREEALSTQFDRVITGDLVVSSSEKDDLDNALRTGDAAPGRSDFFFDSAGNDLIQGLGGGDFIDSWRGGNDQIEGGDGDDWMLGGLGADIVVGGDGRDVLVEGDGDDKLYAGSVVALEDALNAENGPPSGLQGEALSGGGGADVAIGGAGNDVLLGGTGDDILVGGAGDDDIDGDLVALNILPDWSVERTVTAASDGDLHSLSYNQFNAYWPVEGGDDAIYAGGGADWVNGGYGDDYIDGGNDADKVWGGGGNDDIFGGAGNDLISGDNLRLSVAEHGADYLDGEDGDDILFGEGGSDLLFGGDGNDKLYADNGDGNGAGYDFLDGGAGDDLLLGGELDDELFGGDGNDFLQGDSGTRIDDGDDYLDGGAGDDTLLGEGGRDEIHGGDGADRIAGDNGGHDASGDADTLDGGAGNDIIEGQGGDDVIDGGADNDVILGGAGSDLILGGDGDDQLQGGDGDDVVEGGAGSDVLFGEGGNDMLRGGDGTDFLLGGLGDDVLDGGEGDDVYYYSLGEGSDRIADSGGTDWLVFTDVAWGQITLGTGSLKLNLPGGAELHLDDFDADNPHAPGGIEYFQFADGSVLARNELIDLLGIHPTGTPEADVLTGTGLSETIHALAGDDVVTARAGNDIVFADDGADVVFGGDGNDVVHGGAGDDVLLGQDGDDTLYGDTGNDLLGGGAGADTLHGGDGDDTYLFQRGDGQDTATDAVGTNAVVLGAGLTPDAVVFTRQDGDLLVTVKSSTDRLTVKDWFAADSRFARIALGDGTTLDHAGVEAAMPLNQSPVASPDTASVVEDGTSYVTGNALANDSDPEGRRLRITAPGSYAGTAGTLELAGDGAYRYTLANDSQTVQTLALGQSLIDSFAYTVTDDDPNGASSATSSIHLTVQGANDLPIVGADSDATAEDAEAIGGNVLANDADLDAGTSLTVTDSGVRTGRFGSLSLGSDGAWRYSLANDSPLVQSLAAGASAVETFSFTVGDGIARVGASLSIAIAGQNDAPTLAAPLADQSASANSNWNWAVPSGSFADVDAGDVLAYSATLADGTALPSWLTFDAATQTFSGRVPKSVAGDLDIRIAATDRQGATTADVFTLGFETGTGGGGGGTGGDNDGGASQGNEGVGNGADGPPPGHDISFNDGAGTGRGNPGAHGEHGYLPPKRADIRLHDVRIDGRRMAEAAAGFDRRDSADARATPPGQAKQFNAARAVADGTDSANAGNISVASARTGNQDVTPSDAASTGPITASKWLHEAGRAFRAADEPDAAGASSGSGGATVAAFMQWLAVQQATAEQSRGGLPDWLDVGGGADLRAPMVHDGRFPGSARTSGLDSPGLHAAASLRSFNGLGNGLREIA